MRNRNQIQLYILSFFLMLTAVFVAVRHESVACAAGSDRIYYFNMDDHGLEGSMILVETDGHWGLLDAGHRYASTIKDANGATYSVNVNGLSSQVYCRNGKDVANYMINRLGVTHLDFIVGTHAHSDHVGGIPEVAATTYKDSSGRTKYLVDSNTTYYYKEYQHISDLEDDLVRYSSDSWHNQAFAYQAKTAMANRGATLVDVSKSPMIVQGDPNNAYGDYITFNVGNMSFRLYNVHEQTNTGNENVNSIVTVMTNGNYTVVNLADINTSNAAIDMTSKAIAKDYSDVDVVVAGHHGYTGSNTKTMFDSLQPSFVVVPNGQESSWLYTDGDLAAAMPYAQNLFNTAFYNLSISPYAVVTDLSGRQVYVYSVNGKGDLTSAINKMMKKSNKTGWVSWVNTGETLWSYLEKGNSVKNAWRQLDGKWYFFDKTGIMETGWSNIGGKTYYLDPGSGAMAVGWQMLNGDWYYFSQVKETKGKMLTGWQTISGKRYYLGEDGRMAKNTWMGDYYLTDSGAMAVGWQTIGSDRYYFSQVKETRGKKLTGRQTISGKQYYLGSDGRLLKSTWVDGYYLTDSGEIAVGWIQKGGDWYYFSQVKETRGKMLTGWQTISGKRYYLGEDGKMAKNTWVDGYYLTDSGAMAVGWQTIGSDRYYFSQVKETKGKMLTGRQTISGKQYYLGSDGRLLKSTWVDGYYLTDSGEIAVGWIQKGGDWYYFSQVKETRGKMLTGWQTISGKRYYLGEDGKMAKNTWVDGYYLTDSGAMAVGWQMLNGDWYYFSQVKETRGKMLTGWQTISGKRYYLGEDGKMAKNTWVDGYYLTDSGEIAVGWIKLGGNWYYFSQVKETRGKMLTGWQKISGKDYFFYDDGHMAANETTPDGYRVDKNGVWIK